jgi:hypothetical protein
MFWDAKSHYKESLDHIAEQAYFKMCQSNSNPLLIPLTPPRIQQSAQESFSKRREHLRKLKKKNKKKNSDTPENSRLLSFHYKTRFTRISISAWFLRSWKLDQMNWRTTTSSVNVFFLGWRKWDDVSHDSIWKWIFVFLFASTLKHTVFHFRLFMLVNVAILYIH